MRGVVQLVQPCPLKAVLDAMKIMIREPILIADITTMYLIIEILYFTNLCFRSHSSCVSCLEVNTLHVHV